MFGVSVVDDVISSCIKRAEYLLSSTGYSVAYIANECGYKNDVHFLIWFKAMVGIIPTGYRKQSEISIEETKCGRKRLTE